MENLEHFKWFLSHFKVDRIAGDTSAQCYCPAHDDKNASLSISVGDKGIILRCHAGGCGRFCQFEYVRSLLE